MIESKMTFPLESLFKKKFDTNLDWLKVVVTLGSLKEVTVHRWLGNSNCMMGDCGFPSSPYLVFWVSSPVYRNRARQKSWCKPGVIL